MKDVFKVVYTNAHSICNKMDELRCLVLDQNPDFIFVNETWTNDNHSDAFLKLDGYNIICRHDRTDTTEGIGGGLIIWAKGNLIVTEIRSNCLDVFNQCCSVNLSLADGTSVSLVLIYRPHNLYNTEVTERENNVKLCNILKSFTGPSLFIGDFNYSDIDWDHLSATNGSSREFLETVQDCFLTQHVDFPTRVESGTTPDLVLSTGEGLVLDVSDIGKLGSSDHSMLMINVAGSLSDNDSMEEVPDWGKADMEKLRVELSSVDWEEDLKGLDSEQSWERFKEKLLKAQELAVPKKKRRVSNRPVWMNMNTLRIIRKKRRLWRVYKDSKDHAHYLAYKNVEKAVKDSVRNAKKKFEKNLAKNAKKNPKAFWSYLKSKTANRESVGPLKENGEFITDNEKQAEVLNKFFTSVFTEEDLNNVPMMEPIYTDGMPLNSVQFSAELVKEKIVKLKSSAAPGPDKICPKLLQGVVDVICQPLAIIYARSLEEGVVPKDWRCANVTPIFKKGSKSLAGNYRPVSLTCILCKVMESIIRDAIVKHLAENKLLLPSQHGFMKAKSCLTNLLEYLETLTKLVDEGHSVDIIYCDFAKAFDKVPVQRLLIKMEAHGITGKMLEWVRQWLTGRKQRVVLNGMTSGWSDVISGVPQGSCLGPTLFLIFINDIDSAMVNITGIISKFADDTKAGRVVENDIDRDMLQQEINNLVAWTEKWQMKFNESKCSVMHFGRTNPQFSYTMGGYAPAGVVLKTSVEEKDVGVIVHNSLKPSEMCAKAASKANKVLGQMSRAIHFRDRSTWIKLYKTYVRCHLEYCIQAWSPWTQTDKDLLEKVQMRAVRMVSGLEGKTYEERLSECGLTTLEDRRMRGDMIEVFKILHGLEDVEKSTWFKMAMEGASYTTRNTGHPLNITKPRCNLDLRKQFFSVRCCDPWNKLPNYVKESTTLNNFKINYDKWLMEKK